MLITDFSGAAPAPMSLRTKALIFQNFTVTFPHEKVVQVTINRPQKLNCVDKQTSQEISEIWELFDEDETLLVGIITGVGRAFCTGADLLGRCSGGHLILAACGYTSQSSTGNTEANNTLRNAEWNEMNRAGVVNDMSAPGLAGLPRRDGKKPIIAAVNGLCLGGGFEMVANCDLVVAASTALFSLPEAKRGIVPVAGCLPRLTRTLGLQRTMDLVLTGREVSARTLHEWGLVSRVVDCGDADSDSAEGRTAAVVGAAVGLALEICSNSPDAVVVGRLGVRMSWENGSVEEAVTVLAEQYYPRLVGGENFAEGIRAFVEKRTPRWTPSKL